MPVLRKPFISFARLLIWYHRYAPGDKLEGDNSDSLTNETKAELAAAQSVVRKILAANGIEVNTIEPSDFGTNQWLAESNQSWADPGTETLIVPDIRRMFTTFKSHPGQ